MNDINSEILEAIQRNLPGLMANQLAEYLAEAKLTATKLEAAQKANEDLQKEILAVQTERTELKFERAKLLEQQQENDALIAKSEEIVKNYELGLMQIRLDAANNQTNTVIRLVEKVFGHPNVTISKTTSVPIPTGHGSYTTASGFENEFRAESKQ